MRQIHLVDTTTNMTTCKLTFTTFNESQTLDICLLDTFCLILNFSIVSRRLTRKRGSKKLHCFTVLLFINSAVSMSVRSKGLKLHWDSWQTSKWHRSPWDTAEFVGQIDCGRKTMEKVPIRRKIWTDATWVKKKKNGGVEAASSNSSILQLNVL